MKKITFLVFVFSISMLYVPIFVLSWTGPVASPPNSDIANLLDVSSNSQTKDGGLTTQWTQSDIFVTTPVSVAGALPGDVVAERICLGSTSTCWSTVGGGVGGSGRSEQLTKWSAGGTTLVDSNVFDNGTSIGIGSGARTYLEGSSNRPILFSGNAGGRGLFVDTGGKVGIGTGQSAFTYDLQVNGDAYVSGTMNSANEIIAGKWLLSDTLNDTWLRLYSADGRGYYGGFAAGQLWAGTQVTSPRYCIGSSCITAWPSASTLYFDSTTISGNGSSPSPYGVANLNASKITAGTFADARIPSLNASKINAGTLETARIPDLAASKITSGTLDAARIPDLNASKITAGNLDLARLPSCGTGKILKKTSSSWACDDDDTGSTAYSAASGGGLSLASNAFSIANSGVTTARLDALSVTEAKLAADAVTSAKISNGTIVNDDISTSAAIGISKLAGYPTDATKYLRGDGTWTVPPLSQWVTGTGFIKYHDSIYMFSGTLNDGWVSATKFLGDFDGDGSSITSLNASQLTSGRVPTARLGTGTADSTKYLRGDGTWATASPSQWQNLTGGIDYSGGEVHIGGVDANYTLNVMGESGKNGAAYFTNAYDVTGAAIVAQANRGYAAISAGGTYGATGLTAGSDTGNAGYFLSNSGYDIYADGSRSYFRGNVSVGSITNRSDARLKKNIEVLKGSLQKVLQLDGVTFEWKDGKPSAGQQLGVIAQDVQKVFPEVVEEDADGTKTVNYSALVAPLIEAIKEQQLQINELKTEISALKKSR